MWRLTATRFFACGGMQALALWRLACCAYQWDLTQRQVAKILGLRSGSAVSKQLRGLARRMEGDRNLRIVVEAIMKDLKELAQAGRLVSMPDPSVFLYEEGNRVKERFNAMRYFHLGHVLQEIAEREREFSVPSMGTPRSDRNL